tara:strand:+ start:167 stop:460 length:294 start_codon:yes stop_codon:yes gene_type:complete
LGLVPLDLGLVIVSTVLEELAGLQHAVVGLDQEIWLNEGEVVQLLLELSASLLELLGCVFLPPRRPLKLGQVLSLRQVVLQPIDRRLEAIKLLLDLA